ncbi:hypothetical protein PAHAL_2G456800 [Panicum hallii]|uniref:Uncharacterized protein n=1 Tax=Panicum hallii TaxID=206008 RepID=A0A2T8KT03_9POAL|nr:ribonuclease 1-like isoform X1 [Panicum hallii]PVH65301.1 hypothetical protein PAHAL_2G456800 [Panicum hallii]
MALNHHSSLAVLLLALAAACAATDFDFFYLVQQWPGPYCDTEAGCCFPGDEKPAADFGIHGLWPNYAACRPDAATPNRTSCWPDFCNATDTLNLSLVSVSEWTSLKLSHGSASVMATRPSNAQIKGMEADLRRSWGTLSCKSKDATDFWSHEWSRHGTCSGMGQHAYFRSALDLKARLDLTGALLDAGIVPSDEAEYCLDRVRAAVAAATGGAAPMLELECNRSARNETQLYQVYVCVDPDGRTLVHCPLPAQRGCTDMIKFPPF